LEIFAKQQTWQLALKRDHLLNHPFLQSYYSCRSCDIKSLNIIADDQKTVLIVGCTGAQGVPVVRGKTVKEIGS
jgi:hypothetical protein